MNKAIGFLGQAVLYAGFAGLVGYFSASPSYSNHPGDQALLKLSLSHAGKPKGECRRFSAEEIAEMAPNMRRAMDCPRERVPLYVELELDGELLYHAELPPSGIAGDGSSSVYQRFVVEPGRHRLAARLRDSNRESGFDYTHEAVVELAPRQNFVVDFKAATGGFRFL